MESNLWYLVNEMELSFQEIQKYLVDAMRGLNYLHSQNLCHLDIKPDNILIDANGAKLCDFGCIAGAYTNNLTYVSDLGMPLKLRPPECCISLGSDPLIPYEKGCDLWGFGIMLLELLAYFPLVEVETGENWHTQVYPVLFKVLQKEEFFKRVKSVFEDVDDVAVKIALDCVHRFLRKSPYKRMDASVALKHPFFSEKNVASFHRMPKDYMWKKTKTATSKIKRCIPRKFKALRARI
ncbi:hypothetical protein JTE90_002213 [Oedothorax gibbosus]|uniref:Protein kinase domain-containing protein n=1 Tax=Oedothorax gibbosus TaxID=931172 RepID=A0AAV6VI93_9ARAC|nr:hypothetical protein JTE90_002213 [Oedothorax gibbosus]